MVLSRRTGQNAQHRTSAVEAAVVYPLTIFLLIGTVVLGLGVFRYQQVQCLAREGAPLCLGTRPAICCGFGQRLCDEPDRAELH